MRKMKVPFSILLVLCMLLSFAPFRSQASADQEDWEWYWRKPVTRWQTRGGWWEAPGRWYQVDFSPVQIPVENSPSATTAGNATVAGSTTRLVATSFSYYYNEWARTLIVRGTGEMPSFSKEHPAPWANLKDKVSRVILERNITTISSYAFVDFLKLKSVVLPATLKTIDPDAFIWSDEVRASKQFQPLDRLEFSGDLDDLDRILKLCNIQDLLDARIVKVTEKAIVDEIWELTWYRIFKPIRVKYDHAGRPVRIIRVDKDGYTYDTSIQYVNETDLNTKSDVQPISIDNIKSDGSVKNSNLTRDVVEKRQTISVFPDGGKAYYEKERNDLGQQTYYASFGLDSSNRKTNGTQAFGSETGIYKTGTMTAKYATDGSSTITWNNTYWGDDGTAEAYEEVIEQILASGQVKTVTTTKTDTAGNTLGTTKTENTFDEKTGRLASATTTDRPRPVAR